MDVVSLSKRLSYVLRHDPASVEVEVDDAGWVDVGRLLTALRADGVDVDRQRLEALVEGGSKPRFELDPSGGRIRARYGHSIDVDPAHEQRTPPPELYHGTHPTAVDRILEEGLRPMGRQHVHLSEDTETAVEVGARRGRAVVLAVDAAAMHRAGAVFRRAAPGVWLVDAVPPEHLHRR